MRRLRLTRRGTAALVLAAVQIAGGVVLGLPAVSGVGGFAAGAVLVALVPALVRLRPSVDRAVHPRRLERGQEATATLVVRNESGQRQPAFVARDRAGATTTDVDVPALTPGATFEHRYEIPTTRRGQVDVGPLTVERSDLLGLARSRAEVGDVVPLWVHPRRHPVRVAGGGRLRHHHEGVAPDLPIRGTNDLRALREYMPGDELRHVHWRASARIGQLLVREYVDPVQPQCTLVLDNRRQVLSPDGFEEAVEVAASVLWSAVQHEHRVSLHAADGERLRPSSGAEGARALLDRLAAVGQCDDVDLARTLEIAGQSHRGGWLVLVTGAVEPRLLASVAALRTGFAPITIFDVSGWPDAPETPGIRTVRASTASAAVGLWNQQAPR